MLFYLPSPYKQLFIKGTDQLYMRISFEAIYHSFSVRVFYLTLAIFMSCIEVLFPMLLKPQVHSNIFMTITNLDLGRIVIFSDVCFLLLAGLQISC